MRSVELSLITNKKFYSKKDRPVYYFLNGIIKLYYMYLHKKYDELNGVVHYCQNHVHLNNKYLFRFIQINRFSIKIVVRYQITYYFHFITKKTLF